MSETAKEQNKELDQFLTIDVKDIKQMIHQKVDDAVRSAMGKNVDVIVDKLDNFFRGQKSIFSSRGNDESPFDTNLAWAFERALSDGVTEAVAEFGLKEKVKQETIKLLQDKEFLELIAKKQIARSMGINLE